MDELEGYRYLKPETIELPDEVRDRVLARMNELAGPTESRWSRPVVAAISLLAVAALVAGLVVLDNLDSVGEPAPLVAASTPLQSTTSSTTQVAEPLLVGYVFVSLPTGVTADPATEEMVRLGNDIEVTADVQRLLGPKGAFATLTVVREFSGEPPPFEDPAVGTLTLQVSTPVGDGLLVQATEPGGTSVLYIITTSGDLILVSSVLLDAAALEALAQELRHR